MNTADIIYITFHVAFYVHIFDVRRMFPKIQDSNPYACKSATQTKQAPNFERRMSRYYIPPTKRRYDESRGAALLKCLLAGHTSSNTHAWRARHICWKPHAFVSPVHARTHATQFRRMAVGDGHMVLERAPTDCLKLCAHWANGSEVVLTRALPRHHFCEGFEVVGRICGSSILCYPSTRPSFQYYLQIVRAIHSQSTHLIIFVIIKFVFRSLACCISCQINHHSTSTPSYH